MTRFKPMPAKPAAAAHGIAALAGVCMMALPAVFDYSGAARVNDQVVGPIVATLGLVAMWEVTRPVRWVNLLLAAWMIAAVFALDYPFVGGTAVLATAVLAGVLSLVRGERRHDVGGGWAALWRRGAVSTRIDARPRETA